MQYLMTLAGKQRIAHGVVGRHGMEHRIQRCIVLREFQTVHIGVNAIFLKQRCQVEALVMYALRDVERTTEQFTEKDPIVMGHIGPYFQCAISVMPRLVGDELREPFGHIGTIATHLAIRRNILKAIIRIMPKAQMVYHMFRDPRCHLCAVVISELGIEPLPMLTYQRKADGRGALVQTSEFQIEIKAYALAHSETITGSSL